MLAGRLIDIAKDILDEYSQFKIIQHLETASNLSATRGQINEPQYAQQARQLREWAQTVINRTKIEKYPSDLLKFLKESNYSSALPERLARLVMNGFPDNKTAAISSSELSIYIQLANTLRAELTAFVTAALNFKIDKITIPADQISFDIIVPRSVFNDRADEFIETLSTFTRIMSYLIELTTNSVNSPRLAYTSASDPVTGLALWATAAWVFLQLYKLLLEVAEKQLSLIKTLREFRAAALESEENESDLEARVKAIVEKALTEAVEKAIASVQSKVPPDRVNEIKNAVTKDARFAVQAIANGTRIGITIESLDNTSIITEAVPEATPEKIDEIIKDQKALEVQIDQSLVSLGGPAPALLTGKNPQDGERSAGES